MQVSARRRGGRWRPCGQRCPQPRPLGPASTCPGTASEATWTPPGSCPEDTGPALREAVQQEGSRPLRVLPFARPRADASRLPVQIRVPASPRAERAQEDLRPHEQ